MGADKGKGKKRLTQDVTRFAGGWTRAWRKELDSDIWSMPPLYHRVFYYLRQRVNWETRRIPTAQGLDMWLSPGMVVTSLQQIAEGVSYGEYGITRIPNKRTIVKILDWLQSRDMIHRESNGLGTVIKITNWDTYQSNENEKVTRSASQSKRGVHSKKKLEELKEESFFPQALRLSGLLGELILQHKPNYPTLNGEKEETVGRWAEDIERLLRIDKQTPDLVERVIRWAQGDSFWRGNILSGSALRKQFGQLIMKMPTPVDASGLPLKEL